MYDRSGTFRAYSEAAWALALRLGEFNQTDISATLHISMRMVSRIVRGWIAEGACTAIKIGGGHRSKYQVVKDFRRIEPPPEQGSVPLNLWTSMRGLKSFTPTDLAAHSSTASVLVKLEAAANYCQTLLKAGYLKVERTAVPGRREAIYRLIRNTGPRAPRLRRVRAVWDENTAELVLLGEGGQ